MIAMAKKKQPRRSPHRMIRVPLDVYHQLQRLAEYNDRTVGREALRAFRKHVADNPIPPGPAEGTTRG